ncbi:VOC family protein [Terrarubrum flagellatum]|uniref:VOC family protein n=1 Tax=Terrirubrum flagellatum TaxID=2895980 RepID=UPI0031450838
MSGHGTIWWSELGTRDAEKAKAFYGNAIGWTFSEMPSPEGTYYIANVDEKPVAGVFTMKGEQFTGVPEHWMTYINVDNVDRRAEAVVAAGGEVIRAPFDVPGVGRIAIVKDSGGAVVGLGTPAAS